MSYYASTYYDTWWFGCSTKIMENTKRHTIAEATAAALKSPDYAPNLIIHIVGISIGSQPVYPVTHIYKTIQHAKKDTRLYKLFCASSYINNAALRERYWEVRKQLIDATDDIGDIGIAMLEEINAQKEAIDSVVDNPVLSSTSTKKPKTVSMREPVRRINTDFSLLGSPILLSSLRPRKSMFAYREKTRMLRGTGRLVSYGRLE